MLIQPLPPTRRMIEERRRRALDRWLARYGLLTAFGISAVIVFLLLVLIFGAPR